MKNNNNQNFKINRLRKGRYLATFNINGVTEQHLLIRSHNGRRMQWEIEGCIGWNTDFSYDDFTTLSEAKRSLAYCIESQAKLDAGKTYDEPSESHKVFRKRMIDSCSS